MYPFLSHLLSTTALSAMPLSSSPDASSVWLGQGQTPGSPPVPSLNALHSAYAPLLSPPVDIWCDFPSWTPPSTWVLQQDVLWWHRTPSSYQGVSVSGLKGPDPHISLADRWTCAPVFLLLHPRRGPAWISPWGTSSLVRRCSRCWVCAVYQVAFILLG